MGLPRGTEYSSLTSLQPSRVLLESAVAGDDGDPTSSMKFMGRWCQNGEESVGFRGGVLFVSYPPPEKCNLFEKYCIFLNIHKDIIGIV